MPIEDTAMSSFTLMPDQADWDAGAHGALCMVYGLQPVIGTAASAGLTAPGEVLAMLAIVDDGSQHLLLVDAGSGRVLTDLTAPGAPEPPGSRRGPPTPPPLPLRHSYPRVTAISSW